MEVCHTILCKILKFYTDDASHDHTQRQQTSNRRRMNDIGNIFAVSWPFYEWLAIRSRTSWEHLRRQTNHTADVSERYQTRERTPCDSLTLIRPKHTELFNIALIFNFHTNLARWIYYAMLRNSFKIGCCHNEWCLWKAAVRQQGHNLHPNGS